LRLFEAIYYAEDYKAFCRYFDTTSNHSDIEPISCGGDYFAADPNGAYKHLITGERLRKVRRKAESECGNCSAGLVHIRENYWGAAGSQYNQNPSIFYLDIETTAHAPVNVELCNERIVSIQIFHNLTQTNIILGTEDFDSQKHTKNGNYYYDNREYDFKLQYIKCADEATLLESYFKCVAALNPLFVIGHNAEGFDYKYLWERTHKNGIIERFSKYGDSKLNRTEMDNGKVYYSIDAPGMYYMDSLDLYKRFRLAPRASYSLDSLAEVELNEHKVNHDCFSTFDGFRTGIGYLRPSKEPSKDSTLEYLLYHAKNEDEIKSIAKEWFIHYSIIDTYLLYKIDAKLKLTQILIKLASIAGVPMKSAIGTLAPWENYIRNYCMQNRVIMPKQTQRDNETLVVGGYVKDPKPGKYEWVYSVDVTSMYPSQMMAFNMSAETFVFPKDIPQDLRDEMENLKLSTDEQFHLKEYFGNKSKYSKYSELLKKYNFAGALNGAIFRKNFKGVIPILVESVFAQRKAAKKRMLEYEKKFEHSKDPADETKAQELNIEQNALKIMINGLYGALGNPNFILFNEGIANAITGNSRFYVQLFAKNIELIKENQCIYNDTDSVGGDTSININGNSIKISDFYDLAQAPENETAPGKFYKEVGGFKTPAVSENFQIYEKPIKYIMKHRVKKKMFKIKARDKEVIITEDHSLMIKRGEKLLAAKAKDILDGDEIVLNV
jgi:DNA polymerase elongation subunit (family B)